jgi:HSP20 family molecular chaperone IbpA
VKEDIMDARTNVATRERTEVEPRAREAQEPLTLAPWVDIYETVDGITLLADMPGVSKERLNIQADRNNLLVAGDAQIDLPEGASALYADLQATRYRRSFALTGELDPERIEASLKDGVLTLHIPKRAEFRPRRIQVKAA